MCFSVKCVACFKELDGQPVCPYCGTDQAEDNRRRKKANALPAMATLAKRYQLGKMLGAGGFGITYLAKDIPTGKLLAVKEFYPAAICSRSESGRVLPKRSEDTFAKSVRHFYEEAKVLFALNSCHYVAKVEGFFEENNTAYIVMEYVHGETLKQYAKNNGGTISYGQAKKITVQVALALSEVHSAGIVHSDISPSNIMMDEKEDVKLIDFGASRSFLHENDKSLTIQLKPGFAPPEQYSGSNMELGPWTDIYALACTFYLLVTGHMPPAATDRQGGAVVKSMAEYNVQAEEKTERSITKAMELDYRKRYKTADEFIADFSNYQEPGTTDVVEQSVPSIGGKGFMDKIKHLLKNHNYLSQTGMKSQKTVEPYVEVLQGENPGTRLYLTPGKQYLIGRQSDMCDMVVSRNIRISRVHCVLYYDAKYRRIMVSDRSSNGTALGDGRKISNSGTYLENDSILVLATGEVILNVVLNKDQGVI